MGLKRATATGRLICLARLAARLALGPTAVGALALGGFAIVPGVVATAAAEDAPLLRIGVMNDASGPYADTSGPGSVLAARMAGEDAGLVLGRRVEILAADHQNKPDVGAAIVRRWLDQDGVVAIADVNTSSVAAAVQTITREKHRVFLISGAASEDLSGKDCSPYSVQTSDDTRALSAGTTRAVLDAGAKTWFFIISDYTFGHVMAQASERVIAAHGGKVLGSASHPPGATDYSAYLLAAQSSRAQAIALANAGDDTTNTIKQAVEFGLPQGGQRLVGQIMFISHIRALGLPTAQGLLLTESFYWDQNDESRAWSARFEKRFGGKPTREQATTYATVVHYLRAVQSAGTTDAEPEVAAMKTLPMKYFGKTAHIRRDGRAIYDLELYQVKSPAESHYDWDYYKPVQVLAGADAFVSEADSSCPLLRAAQ